MHKIAQTRAAASCPRQPSEWEMNVILVNSAQTAWIHGLKVKAGGGGVNDVGKVFLALGPVNTDQNHLHLTWKPQPVWVVLSMCIFLFQLRQRKGRLKLVSSTFQGVLQWPSVLQVQHLWHVIQQKIRRMTAHLTRWRILRDLNHVNMNQNLKGMFPISCGIHGTRNGRCSESKGRPYLELA